MLVEWTEPESDLPILNYTISVTDLDSSSMTKTTVMGNSTILTDLTEGVSFRVEIVSKDVIGPGDSNDMPLQFVIDCKFEDGIIR